ncbi:hypothetical protein CK203_020612 [Vitis vinifera]|uniref:Uncharacterized protein n=1 Tax=Vitis vinifera TaxID=29760 RepID=A0A438FMC1_VITVI|nr:hypothetical protein CK203_020612 [Vitis vinifera]
MVNGSSHLGRAGEGLEDDIREGGMSVFGGDSWAREAQHRKRKVEDLMVEGLDASSYKKLSTGKFACLLCANNPILDSPLMLSHSCLEVADGQIMLSILTLSSKCMQESGTLHVLDSFLALGQRLPIHCDLECSRNN